MASEAATATDTVLQASPDTDDEEAMSMDAEQELLDQAEVDNEENIGYSQEEENDSKEEEIDSTDVPSMEEEKVAGEEEDVEPYTQPQRLRRTGAESEAAVELPQSKEVTATSTLSQASLDADNDDVSIEELLEKAEAAKKEEETDMDDEEEADIDEEEETDIDEEENGSDGASEKVAVETDKTNMEFDFNTTQGVAACLLIKDDNHWVIEWLAYHWFVLPLRHLIVVIDPDSKTSPKKILDRWKGLMQIEIWEESSFLKPIPESTLKIYENNTQLMHHRHRQTSFYMKCLRYFQNLGMPWVMLTDTDEFITLNYRGLQKHKNPILQNMAKEFPIQKPGSVLQSLLYHRQATGRVQKCVYLQRYQVGSREANATLVGRFLPNTMGDSSDGILQPQDFLTQRFLYETENKTRNGKNMMHVTAVKFVQANANVHRVSLHCPSREGARAIESTAFFKLNHYLGTLEQFSYRSDPRAVPKTDMIPRRASYDPRNLDAYVNRGEGANYLDTNSQGWIEGFIQQVGLAKATELLAGVGQVGVE